jgi:site-specific DNA-methyltransferase (cytosine-N4-specific)
VNLITCRLKPYIQPFERKLALEELRVLSGTVPIPVDGTGEKALIFSVRSCQQPFRLADRLAYWETVHGDRAHLTRQVCLEATANLVRNGTAFKTIQACLPFQEDPPLPNRRCLRYGTHGIHEYRGKFFPQLVRALMNIAFTKPRALVADPMCGSGTTLVEGIVSGHKAIGLDLNPLSVLLSRVKCSLLFIDAKRISTAYEKARDKLLHAKPMRAGKLSYFTSLPVADQDYLMRWFAPQILSDLDQIMIEIDSAHPAVVRDLMRISLSNILRRVSWQKEADLRVRKEIRFDEDIDPIREFLEELGRTVRIIVAFLRQNQGTANGLFEIAQGDARTASAKWGAFLGKVDAVITSPPYATALPYLDTDRLSLIYLKLLTRPEHRKRDQEMIGNREITTKSRDQYWQSFQQRKGEFPKSVVALIEKIDVLNTNSPSGFRRKNLASLLTKYFADMRDVLRNSKELLKKGAAAYIVVGNNHTIAGGRHVAIETAELLTDLAKTVGFQFESRISMEMLVSREIFRKNAVASEYILCLRKPA